MINTNDKLGKLLNHILIIEISLAIESVREKGLPIVGVSAINTRRKALATLQGKRESIQICYFSSVTRLLIAGNSTQVLLHKVG